MQENSNKPRKRDAVHSARVTRTAKLCGVSTSTVYKVLNCDRDSEIVVSVFMTLKEKEREMENELLDLVKELLPFDKPYKGVTQQAMPKETNAGHQNNYSN